MSHQEAVVILKRLPKDHKWSARQALDIIGQLDAFAFARLSDYAEAVTAAMIGQRWEAVSGRQGYDTASTLVRWLGKAARQYRNPVILFDAKTRERGIGYSDKVTERANKATEFNEYVIQGEGSSTALFFTRETACSFSSALITKAQPRNSGRTEGRSLRRTNWPSGSMAQVEFCPRFC